MKKITNAIAALLFSSTILLLPSCSKQDDANQDASSTTIVNGSVQDQRVKALISRLPVEKLVNDRNARIKNAQNGNRTSGWDFAYPSGNTFSSGSSTVTTSSGPSVFTISSSSMGGNTGGGTVVAGQTSLNINYTFCFAATDSSASGLNMFDLGNGGFSGVSGVIGVDGDFSQLGQSSDSATDFSDIFHGLAFYIVFDGTASGSYDVIDWLDGITDSSAVTGNSFAYAFDFVNGRLYLSKSGTISVSGGQMEYQGDYLEVSGFMNEDGDFDLGGTLTYRTVSGFGAMGCN